VTLSTAEAGDKEKEGRKKRPVGVQPENKKDGTRNASRD